MDTPSDERVADAIRTLDAAIGQPHPGSLPLEVFLLVSRLMPLFTADVWIEDDAGRVLLTWREDPYFGSGWHVPGSVVRFQESIAHRLRECAREELGAEIEFDPLPFDLMEEIQEGARDRGHNISAAYRCRLLSGPDPARAYHVGSGDPPRPGEWAWHTSCPPDILTVHRCYERHFKRGV
jgi:ADP-ribose pyrophosphatase YjhB (NUDIX family)